MPKFKSEYAIVTSIILFFISSAMDKINGSLKIVLKSPYAFLDPKLMSTYPFTGVSILLKVVAMTIFILLLLSLIEKRYLLKIITILTLSILAQLYAIQQFATGLRVTPTEWTLAFAFAGILLLPSIIYYIFASVFKTISSHTKLPTVEKEPTKKSLSVPKPIKTPKSFNL